MKHLQKHTENAAKYAVGNVWNFPAATPKKKAEKKTI